MANRKVLINRHTSSSGAPIASEMFHGEIAVAHKTGEEILWTKNNADEMVPFISCAQTKTMIDNAIAAANVSYDVKKAEGEAFINVGKATDGSAVTFTLSSDDIQSKAAFDTYSAATDTTIKENYNTLSGAIDDVLAIITTAITGDNIISVTPTTSGAGSYALAHKTATAVTGFNKLETDAYGHVTASTAVSTSDIEALGFKNSADTADEIASAITALGAVSASTGKYFTAIGVENGKLAMEEANLPVLEVESAGTGNVVASITVTDHKISYQTASVATSEGIAELSAATIALSAGTVHDLDELSGATQAISGYAHDEIAQLSGATQAISGYAHDEIAQLSGATVAGFNSAFTAIQAMDKAADVVAGQVVTTVSEVDGVVSETKANVKDLQLGGYAKDTTATGDIESADTINAALSKLENKANAITIDNADGSINVTTGANGTDINVNIKSGEHVLAKDGSAGLYTNIKLSGVTPSSDLVKEEFVLYGTDNTVLGDHIKIYKDQSLVSITLEDNDGSGHTGQYLKYTYIDASGDTQSTYVNVSSFLVEAEFKSGVTADASGVVHGVVDPASEKDSNNDSFLTVGADGFKVDGIKDEIDAKIAALDKTDDAAVAGQYVAAIEETDGVVAVKTRANVSEAVLNNYAKESDATAVAATDTVNQAISKLENQVEAAKAAATTKVVEGTDAGNNMTIVPTTGDDSSVTYTVNLTDVASKTALDAEIAARKAVDGQNGDTYAANSSANYISGATSLNDADVKLDAAIKDIADIIADLDSTGVANDSGHYLTAITITDGKITSVGQEELPAATPVTTVNGTTGDTAAAVIASVVTGGTEGHQLTLNYSNKVFSATTAESALTSESAITSLSALTSVSAISATTALSAETTPEAEKVAHALSVSGYSDSSASTLDTAFAYDGSNAKSLTFGTNGPAGLKSMSMTSAGIVDVEVIDCGEY